MKPIEEYVVSIPDFPEHPKQKNTQAPKLSSKITKKNTPYID